MHNIRDGDIRRIHRPKRDHAESYCNGAPMQSVAARKGERDTACWADGHSGQQGDKPLFGMEFGLAAGSSDEDGIYDVGEVATAVAGEEETDDGGDLYQADSVGAEEVGRAFEEGGHGKTISGIIGCGQLLYLYWKAVPMAMQKGGFVHHDNLGTEAYRIDEDRPEERRVTQQLQWGHECFEEIDLLAPADQLQNLSK